MPIDFLATLQASPVMTVLGWGVTFLVHSTLLIGLVWLATRFGWVGSPHLRETLWKTALVGGLISASVQTVSGPALFVRELPVEGKIVAGTPGATQAAWADVEGANNLWVTMVPEPVVEERRTFLPAAPEDLQARILGGGGLAEGLPGVAAWSSASLADESPVSEFGPGVRLALAPITAWVSRHAPYLLLVAWLLGAGWALARLVRSHRRLHRGLKGREEVRDAQVLELLDGLRAAGEVRRPVRLTTHPRLSGPIAFGRGEICLPARVLTDLDRDQQESVLAHELGHVVRRDPAWLTVGGVLQGLFFFQPLIRTARRRLQEEAEFLCDDWAVTHTGRGLVLARCLARVADWVAARPHAVPVSGMAAGDSPLVRRVERLLDESRRPSRGLPPAARLAVLLSAVGVAALFAPGLSARVRPAAPVPVPLPAEVPVAPGAEPVVLFLEDAPTPPVVLSQFGLDPVVISAPSVKIVPRVAPAAVASPRVPFPAAESPAPAGGVIFYDDGKVSVGRGEPLELLHFVSARPMIGVTIGDVDEALRVHLGLDEGEGALITRVIEGGAAEDAGLEPYDIVLTCDGETVDQARLIERIRAHEDGESVTLTVLRRGERKTFEVEVRESDQGLPGYFAPGASFPGPGQGVWSSDAPFPEGLNRLVVPDARFPREIRDLLAPRAPEPQTREEALRRLQELETELQQLVEELERNPEAARLEDLESLRRRAELLEREQAVALRRQEDRVHAEFERQRAAEARAQWREQRLQTSRTHDRYAEVLKEIEVAGLAKLREELADAALTHDDRERDRLDQALAAAVEETVDELILSFKDGEVRIENDSRELRDRLRSRIAIECERRGVALDGADRQAVDAAVDATVVHLRYLELN